MTTKRSVTWTHRRNSEDGPSRGRARRVPIVLTLLATALACGGVGGDRGEAANTDDATPPSVERDAQPAVPVTPSTADSAAPSLVHTAPSTSDSAAADEDLSTALTDRAAAMAEASRIFDTLGASAPSDADRARLLTLFDVVYGSQRAAGEPLPNITDPRGMLLAGRLAAEGNAGYLAALMRASDGWYGRTGEGGEWINELLWEALIAQPGLTLSVLAEFSAEDRERLVADEYTRPIHDAFDFAAAVTGLRSAKVPPGMEEQVEQIISVAEASIY